MQQVFVAGDEPVPGYRLIDEIEGTAFYKVWRVETPEGTERSWKIIDLVVGNAAVETRTLGLLVRLRHAAINTLTNFWNLDDGKTLIIESELPRLSLRARLAECQREGHAGMSREDVIGYLESAAEGLDFLNRPQHEYNGQQVAIYHRSLRPECLLLFEQTGGTVCKVSDFGLSKPVTEEMAQHSQGLVHYDYDPPEFFEGQTSPTSDQYSLAVVYYELRTGEMPFRGTMLEQLQARLSDRPDLSKIEEPERSILRKALSRDASHRFKNCLELIRHLREGVIPADMVSAAARTAEAPRRVTPAQQGVSAPRPGDSGLGTPGWRSPAAAMQTRPVATDANASVTMTPPPPAQGVVFHRPRVDGTPAATTDSGLLRRTSPTDSSLLRSAKPAANGTVTETTVSASIQETQPVTKTPINARTKGKPAPDLRSIREHIGSTQFGLVDTYSGEKRVPLTWVALILTVTAVGSIWLTNLIGK